MLLGILVTACGPSEPSPSADTAPADGDDDGYALRVDCNDSDPLVFPGATETCDGQDEDCDGEVDEGVGTAWYLDADGDGYGNVADGVVACASPAGRVEDSADCDDDDWTVYPGAGEHCDDRDEDCDGEVDEDAADQAEWYVDADGDGYGDPSTTRVACDAAPGMVLDATDCDDADAATSPGADETCDNGTDDDCDGEALCRLGAALQVEDADAVIFGTQRSSYVGGGRALALLDVDNDGNDDLVFGALRHGDGVCDGSAFLFRGPIVAQLDVELAEATWVGSNEGCLGYGVGPAGDADGDGLPDIAMTAPYDETGGSGGVVYVVSGADRGEAPVETDHLARLLGEGSVSVGFVDSAGDVDGDGSAEIIVGARGAHATVVWVAHGPVSGTSEISTATRIAGEYAGERSWHGVAGVGDVDGDGLDDVGVGEANLEAFDSAVGATYVLLGPVSGVTSLGDAETRLTTDNGSNFGIAVSGGGDLDDDGLDDVVVGASKASGRVYVFDAIGAGDLDADAEASAVITGAGAEALGFSVARAGDVDGDGAPDLVAGAPYGDDWTGAADLYYGPFAGTIAGADAPRTRIVGFDASDYLGYSVAGAGDLDGDGTPDLVSGAIGADAPGLDSAGAVYVVHGLGF